VKKLTLILGLLFLVIGCSLESVYSLPNDENINSDLLGEWYVDGNDKEKIIISKHGDKTYKLILNSKDVNEEIIMFSKTIAGIKIMNL